MPIENRPLPMSILLAADHAAAAPTHPVIDWLMHTRLAQGSGRVATAMYGFLVVWPMQHLYVRGIWGNRPFHDICAEITQHRSEFWARNPEECLLILENNFDSWVVWLQVVVYFVFLAALIRKILRCFC